MERRAAIFLSVAIALLASISVGYAYALYAESLNEDVDGRYIVINGLSATAILDYDSVYDSHGGTAGMPLDTTSVRNGSDKLTYLASTNVPDEYYLQLDSYVLRLDDGTVIKGTVDTDGNHTSVDYSASTVVTGSSLKLTLDSLIINEGEIRFTVAGSVESDSGLPVAQGTPAPAMPAYVDNIDVRIKLISGPAPSLASLVLDAHSVSVGGTYDSSCTVKMGGTTVYGYSVNWSQGEGVNIGNTGKVTGLSGMDEVAVTAALDPTFGSVSQSRNISVVTLSALDKGTVAAGGSLDVGATVVKTPSGGTVAWGVNGSENISVDSSGVVTADAGAVRGEVQMIVGEMTYDGVTVFSYTRITVI